MENKIFYTLYGEALSFENAILFLEKQKMKSKNEKRKML